MQLRGMTPGRDLNRLGDDNRVVNNSDGDGVHIFGRQPLVNFSEQAFQEAKRREVRVGHYPPEEIKRRFVQEMGNWVGREEEPNLEMLGSSPDPLPVASVCESPEAAANGNNGEKKPEDHQMKALLQRMALMESHLRAISNGKIKEVEDIERQIKSIQSADSARADVLRGLRRDFEAHNNSIEAKVRKMVDDKMTGFENQLEKFSRIAATAADQGEQMLMAYTGQSEVIEYLRRMPGSKNVTVPTASEDKTCIICMEGERTHAFLHEDGYSAHAGFCQTCAERILRSNNPCPTCRKELDCVIKLN